MDLEPLIRSYAKSFITSADLTSLVTVLVGSLAALWLGKRVTTFVLTKGFSLSWRAAKWLFSSRPLGDVAAEILRAMEYLPCETFQNNGLIVGDGACWVYPKTQSVHVNGYSANHLLSRHERKRISHKAAAIRVKIFQHEDSIRREQFIARLRGDTPRMGIAYYQGGQVCTRPPAIIEAEAKPASASSSSSSSSSSRTKQPTPTVTPEADVQPTVTWNYGIPSSGHWQRALTAEEVKAEHEKAMAGTPLILPPDTPFVGNSVCTCEGDEECDICRAWAMKAMAAADRRAPK